MFYLLFLLILAPLSAGEFYGSDGLGRRGAAVEEPGSELWVLELDGNIRTLFKEGIIYKKWITSTLSENGRILSREEYYFGEALRTVSISDGNGRLLRETLYNSKGEFMIEHHFSYSSNGRISQIQQLDENGSQRSIRTLRYRADGSLRELRSEDGERINWRAASYSEKTLDSLFLDDHGRADLFSYEDGKMTGHRESRNDELLYETEFIYGADGYPDKEIRFDYSGNSRRILYFDENGKVVIQSLYVNEILEQSERNRYEGDLLVEKALQTSDSRLRWEYEYRDGESDPYITRQFINGSLVKESEKVEEGIRENLFRQGKLILTRIRTDEP